MQRIPSNITLHKKSGILEVEFDEVGYQLPFEYLRVYSPSAEVKGHGPGQETLQIGKEQVQIVAIEPVGNYAVRLIFSDSHNSGIYSWDVLYELGNDRVQNWSRYLQRLVDAGVERQPQANDHLLQSASNAVSN